MKQIIKNRKGEGYIDICVGILALLTVLVLSLNIYSFLTLKQDMDEITEMITLLRRSSNNLNQIAKKVNSTGTIYGEEIAQIRNDQDEIWKLSREILAQLSALS